MKRKRFSVEQIVAVLKQADMGMAVADLTRQVGISEQTSQVPQFGGHFRGFGRVGLIEFNDLWSEIG